MKTGVMATIVLLNSYRKFIKIMGEKKTCNFTILELCWIYRIIAAVMST